MSSLINSGGKIIINSSQIMNIIQVNSHYEYSSIGRTTMEMHEYMISKGFGSFVFCINKDDPQNNIYKVVNHLEYRLNGIHSRISGLEACGSHFPTWRMLKKWDTISPDVVILRNIHSDYVNLPMILKYCARNNIATVLVHHDFWFFTGHCTYYTKIKCQKWLTQCESCPGLKEGNPTWFLDTSKKVFNDRMRLFNKIDNLAAIGVSDWTTNEAKQSPMYTNAKVIKRIYNWINLDIFYPRDTFSIRQSLGIKDEPVILGISQSWIPAKGLYIFIDIAKHFPNCRIVMVGNVKEEDRKMMPDNILTPGVLKDVTLLANYYSLADVFVNPSLQETFGKVTAEALACGTPVVVNDATATPEIAGDCGIVVHNNNMDEYYSSIEKVLALGKSYYTSKCVERANTLFNKNKNLEEYVELFRTLTEPK